MSKYEQSQDGPSQAGITRVLSIAALILVCVVAVPTLGCLAENVNSDEIVIIQSIGGTMTPYITPGPVWQGFGKVTSYPKRQPFDFEVQVRFNDGGHGTIFGSVQWEMPTDRDHLIALHTKFGSPQSIQAQLVEKAVNKSVYMTGPLMSSKESYAEKRNYLINYIEDQISNGVYKTVQRDVKILDPLTGTEKTAVQVEIVQEGGVPARQELSALGEFGIRTFNFAINKLPYDETVEKQIQAQQQITMDVQTAIAESRKAEQRKLTTEQQGQANAAQAKWEQEVIKAKFVTEAQQKLEVAKLDTASAEQYKLATLLRADADAGYRKQVMAADGALEKKLQAYVMVQQAYADAIKNLKVPLVPSTVLGTSGGAANGVQTFMDLQTIKAAKELGLENIAR